MEKKLALLASLNEAYFSLTDNDGDTVYFMGDAAKKAAEYKAEMSSEYDDYFEECNNGDDQTAQVPMSLDEWKKQNEYTIYNWCAENCEFVDDEVEAETRKGSETDYFRFESNRYLVCEQDEIEKHYDERCEQDIDALYMSEVPEGFIKSFLENHEAELLAFYQRDTNAGEVLSSENGEDTATIDGALYSIFKQ